MVALVKISSVKGVHWGIKLFWGRIRLVDVTFCCLVDSQNGVIILYSKLSNSNRDLVQNFGWVRNVSGTHMRKSITENIISKSLKIWWLPRLTADLTASL